MRRIGLVTCDRSDFWIYVPLLEAIRTDPRLELQLVATGSHLADRSASSTCQIETAGFEIFASVESLDPSNAPAGIGRSMAAGVSGFAELFSHWQPDILVVLGDRFDMLPAPLAALPYHVPVAHLHGGELSAGAIDDSLRHCITKLSHLHLVATSEYARRVIQLGEEPWRVTVTGAPALDAIARTELLDHEALKATFGISPSQPFLLVTFHPATLDRADALEQLSELLDALRSVGLPCVFTSPNLDTGGPAVQQCLEQHCRQSRADRLVGNAGQQGYFSLMSAATAMVGNSSSGIIEAPSFRLPVVNIGDRQRGRTRARNVIDCSSDRRAIRAAIERASSLEFRQRLARLSNPFGDGRACERIIEVLASASLGTEMIQKSFHDVDQGAGRTAPSPPSQLERSASARAHHPA